MWSEKLITYSLHMTDTLYGNRDHVTLSNNVRYNTKIHSEGRLGIHTVEPTAIHKEVV
jgi:hypothetical protein